MKYILLILVCLAGCGMPETARATRQAEQAVEGISMILDDAVPVINEIKDEEQRKKLQEGLRRILVLVQSARLSLQPVITYLGEVKVETTSKEAASQPEIFATKAALQSGRAAVEVEDRLSWNDMFLSFVDPSSLEGWLVGLSTLLLGSGTAGIIIARVVKTIGTYKNALVDQVAYTKKTKELDASDPEDAAQIAVIKEQEAERQKARGTKAIIDEALQKVKHGTHT